MRPVYAARLVMYATAGEAPKDHHLGLVAEIYDWVRALAGKFGREDLPLESDGNITFTGDPNGCYGECFHYVRADMYAWKTTLAHPYVHNGVPSPDMQLRTEIQLFTEFNESTFTLRLLMGSLNDAISPESFMIRRPRIIQSLIESHNVMVGNLEVRVGPWVVDSSQVRELVADITRPDRQIPIVVISKTIDNQPLVSADRCARELAGIGQVVELAHFETAFQLTSLLGKEFSTFNGAVRIYWPRFSITDNRYHHPLFLPTNLSENGLGDRLPLQLLSTISDIAAWRIGSDRRVWELERSVARETEIQASDNLVRRMADLQKRQLASADLELPIRQELKELQLLLEKQQAEHLESTRKRDDEALHLISQLEVAHQREVQEYRDLLDLAQSEANDLRINVNRKSAQIMELRSLDKNREYDRYLVEFILRSRDAKSLDDLVTLFEEASNNDYLRFLPEAHDSAKKSSFRGNLDGPAKLLFALCSVSAKYRSNELEPGIGFKQAFAEAGEPDYRHNSSDLTLGKYRRYYERAYENEDGMNPILLGPHLTFGGGNARSSVKIYWYVDERWRRFVVGHIGDHLPIVSHS